MIHFCIYRYDDSQKRRRLRVHQRRLRTLTGVPLSLGGVIHPRADGKCHYSAHIRAVHLAACLARMRATVRSSAAPCRRDNV